MLSQGLEIELLDEISSLPYLEMTLAMMRQFGAEFEQKGRMIKVFPKPYQPTSFVVEPDWSAASYWYEMAAFSEECEIKLRGLSLSSLQGDAIVAEWMKSLGVNTIEDVDSLVLRKVPFEKRPLHFDFFHQPDLYPTMAATCVGLEVEADFTGLDNLALKESSRVEAMQEELTKLGRRPVNFCAHVDHRIVMALAPLSMLMGPVAFDHPEVVKKSYPRFWFDADFLPLEPK